MKTNNLFSKITLSLMLLLGFTVFVHADRTANGVPGDGVLGNVLQSLGGSESIWVATSSLGISGGSAGSDGNVQYNNSGAFGATSTFFWDKTNGRLGIGFNSPSYPLSVRIPAALSQDCIITFGNTNNPDTGCLGNTGTNGLNVKISGNSTLSDIIFAPGNSELMRMQAVNNGGNVGIGTSAPGAKLDVAGALFLTSNSIPFADFFNNNVQPALYYSGNTGSVYPFLTAGNLVIQPRTSSGNARDIVFATGGTTPTARMVINSSGNVGIGTTSPSEKLQIQGGLRLTGNFKDSTNATGTSGQVLQSTGTSTLWVTPASAGTVTSVSLTTPTGLTAASTTCTVACVLGISLTAGYEITKTASSTNWELAFASTTALTPAYIKSQITGTYPIIVTSGVVSTGFSTSTTNNYTGVNTFTAQTNLATASSSAISTGNFYATGTVSLATTTVNGNFTITGTYVPRVTGYASNASTTFDVFNIGDGGIATTTITGTTTIVNPTGVLLNGLMFEMWLKATTTQGLYWGTNFASSTDVQLPTQIASGTTKVIVEYRQDSGKLECAYVNKTFAN